MEFSQELLVFQGVITSIDNIHPFMRLSEKGGNEEEIKYVVNTLLKFLQERNLINNVETIATLRKFAMYIVLNTNLQIIDELMDVEEICPFINTIPTLPTCLMSELFWNLHMDTLLYEIITFSFPPLALAVAEAIIDHFKYFNPTEYLDKLRNLTTACYTNIGRFIFFEFESNNLSINLTNAFNNFIKSIKYFTDPPNSHKLNTLTEDELYKLKGKCLYAALLCAYDCSIQFISKQERYPNTLFNIYELTYPHGSVKDGVSNYKDSDSHRKKILEVLDDSINKLLDTANELVMDITIEIFCAWDEFEEDGRTMQQIIGELCYKLRSKLLEINSLCDHPLVSKIQQITRKPVDIKDLINSLDTEAIIVHINKNNNEKKKWLQALIDKEQLFEHADLLKIIEDNIENYNEEECFRLFEVLKNNTENDLTNSLIIKVFQYCNNSDKLKILTEKYLSTNRLVNMKESVDFDTMLTEIFNKLVISQNADFTDILVLFLQNPRKVYVKIFNLAIENNHQTDIMLKAMKLIEKFSNCYYDSETESCVIKVTQNTFNLLESETKQNSFVKFIHSLKETGVIPGVKLLLLIIMPNLHQSLLSRNIDDINIQIKLLREVYPLEEIVEYRSPMLAMLAQVLDIARWRIDTFISMAPVTLQNVLLLHKSLISTYNNFIPENESKWLKGKLRNLQPLNMYYYRCLWNPPGDNFLQVISAKNINNLTSTDEVTKLLSQILCSCTQQEWSDIWDSLTDFNDYTIFKMFDEALSIVAVAEKYKRTTNTWQCLLYCYRNLISIIRYKFLKEPLSNDQVITVVNTLSTLPILQSGKTDEIEPLLLPLLSYLYERKCDYTICLPTCTQLHDENLINLINKVFTSETE